MVEKKFLDVKKMLFEVLDEVKPLMYPKPNSPNYRFLSAEKKLAITLYYLKYTGSLWMTANTLGIHQCTVSKTIFEVCKANNAILHIYTHKTFYRKFARLLQLQTILLFKCSSCLWQPQKIYRRWMQMAWVSPWCKGVCLFGNY